MSRRPRARAAAQQRLTIRLTDREIAVLNVLADIDRADVSETVRRILFPRQTPEDAELVEIARAFSGLALDAQREVLRRLGCAARTAETFCPTNGGPT